MLLRDLLHLRALGAHHCPVELLLYLAVNGDLLDQVLDNLLDPGHGAFDAVLGTLQGDLVTGNTIPWEADDNASKVVANLAKHLAAPGNKVAVVFGINSHGVFHNVVQLKDARLEVSLGLGHSLLGPNDGDALPVRVSGPREDDPGTSIVSDLLDVAASASNEELVVLRLRLHLDRDSGELFLVAQLAEELDRLLHVINRSTDGHLVRSGTVLGELDGDSATLAHDALDQLATCADHGVVNLGRNHDLLGDDVRHLALDLLDRLHCLHHVLLLAGNGDHVTVCGGIWEVDASVSLVSDPPDVGTALSNDKLVELLEDWHLCLVAAFQELLGDLVEVPGTLVHVILGPAQLHNVTLAAQVREADLDRSEFLADLLDLASFCADQLSVEPVLDDQVLLLLILHLVNH